MGPPFTFTVLQTDLLPSKKSGVGGGMGWGSNVHVHLHTVLTSNNGHVSCIASHTCMLRQVRGGRWGGQRYVCIFFLQGWENDGHGLETDHGLRRWTAKCICQFAAFWEPKCFKGSRAQQFRYDKLPFSYNCETVKDPPGSLYTLYTTRYETRNKQWCSRDRRVKRN